MTTAADSNARDLPTAQDVMNGEPPAEIRVGAKGATLSLEWTDGTSLRFTAPFLRENSQSAGSKKLRLSGLAVPASRDLTIKALRPIGSYAINIVFSDGYERGIYPWAYLRRLDEDAASEPEIPALRPEDFLKCN